MEKLIACTIKRAIILSALVKGGDRTLAPLPTKAIVEVSSHCNLRCSYCPTETVKSPSFMSLDTWRTTIDAFVQRDQGVRLSINGNGEPLLNPHLLDMLQVPVPNSVVVQMISNGTLLNERNIEGMIDSNLNFLQFSVDSITRAEYERARPGKNPGKDYHGPLMRNLLKLIVENERAGHPLFLSISVMGSDNVDINRQMAFWRPLVDNVFVNVLNNFGANREIESPGEIHDQSMRPPCGHLYDYIYVRADGSIKACCEDVHARYVVGDIGIDRLEAIWNGARMRHIREVNLAPELLKGADLNGLDCYKCDSPWRGLGLFERIDFISRSLTIECKAKMMRQRPAACQDERIVLCEEYLQQMKRYGEICELIAPAG